MKNDRQKKIIELVENRCIETQEQLLDQLRQCGFHSTPYDRGLLFVRRYS